MPITQQKRVPEPLTQKVEARIDIRHFAALVHFLSRKGIRIKNQSQFIRTLFEINATTLFGSEFDEQEKALMESTAVANDYLMKEEMISVKSIDRSVHYARAKQYEAEEKLEASRKPGIIDSYSKVKNLTPVFDDRAAELLSIHNEVMDGNSSNPKLTEVAQEAMVNDRNGFIKPVFDNPLENNS